jgi:hypothetical protein
MADAVIAGFAKPTVGRAGAERRIVADGQYIAIITDPRHDEPLGRRHRDNWNKDCCSEKQDQME